LEWLSAMASIRGILSFVETVSRGSFAAAARELNVSPVAVSKNVARLERELGVRLLQRSTRKLTLTEEGHLFYDRCAGPLRELEGARSAARERAGTAAGTIRVTSVVPFGLGYVLPLIPVFASRYPKIEIEFHLDDTVNDMISGRYDVGFRVGQMPDRTFVARPIAHMHFVVCGSPAYLAKHPPPRGPSDLVQHNCLRLRHAGSGRFLDWSLERHGEKVSRRVSGNFRSNDLGALIAAATLGLGLVYAPLPRMLPLLRRGELSPVLPEWVSPDAEVYLHYPTRRGQPARAKSFVDFMLKNLRRNSDLQGNPRKHLAQFLKRRRRCRSRASESMLQDFGIVVRLLDLGAAREARIRL